MANGYFIKGTEPEALEQAWEKIVNEFMYRYLDFIRDVLEYDDSNSRDFAWKYGFTLTAEGKQKYSKDNQKTLAFFQRRVFSGRFLPAWEKEGFNKYTIWGLHNEGLLSCDSNYSWQARQTGNTDFYYISQRTACAIRKKFEGKA